MLTPQFVVELHSSDGSLLLRKTTRSANTALRHYRQYLASPYIKQVVVTFDGAEITGSRLRELAHESFNFNNQEN